LFENVFLADSKGRLFRDSIGGKSVGIELAKLPAYAIHVEKAMQGEVWVGEAQQSPATGHGVWVRRHGELDAMAGRVGNPATATRVEIVPETGENS
jgi:hypothetical protein